MLPSCRAVGVHFARSITLPVFPPPHLQFFVASDPTVKTDRLWHDKYTLRTSMIPSFMTMDQCRKVGSCGLGHQCAPASLGQGRSAVERARGLVGFAFLRWSVCVLTASMCICMCLLIVFSGPEIPLVLCPVFLLVLSQWNPVACGWL